MAQVVPGGYCVPFRALTSGSLRAVLGSGSSTPPCQHLSSVPSQTLHPHVSFYCGYWFNLCYCYSPSTKGQKVPYVQQAYFISFFICTYGSYLGLPAVFMSIFSQPDYSCICSPSLPRSVYIHIQASKCMPVDTPSDVSLYVHVCTFFIVHVYTHTHTESHNLQILERNPLLCPHLPFQRLFLTSGHWLFL